VNLSFTPQSWEDYQYWLQTDKKVLKRINELIRDTLRSPHEGIGKPEPLRQGLSGYWSRRITEEHRMIYRQVESGVILIQLRYHYSK
jgi:toxin YoeB